MKKHSIKECKYIIMPCTIFVILPGWCTNHGNVHALFIHSENIMHYHYGAYMICIIIKVHVNNHAYTKNNHF